MDVEFMFRDEKGRPTALPSLAKWRNLTAIPFSRRPPEMIRIDALYADLLRVRPGGHAFLRKAIVLKGALNHFIAGPADSSKSRRVDAGGGTMKRLFQALAEFTGDLAAMPSPARAIGIPPSEHEHARFGILWVLSHVKVAIRPSALLAGSLDGLDVGLSLAQAVGAMPQARGGPIGFASQQVRPHVHRDAKAACPAGDTSFFQKIKSEIVKLLKDFVTGIWEDLKAKARFFVHPSWEGFANIVDTAAQYLLQFVKQIPTYVSPAYDLLKGLRQTFRSVRAALRSKGLLGRFEPTAGHVTAYVEMVEREARQRAIEQGIEVAATTAFAGLGFAIPLVTAVIKPIVRTVSWVIRAFLRVAEKIHLEAFLQKARRHFEAEPRLGEGPLRFQPATSGGLVHDAARFDAFFDEGCRISPIVPFLALNTGVCGALLTKVRLTGHAQDSANEQAYLAALRYFDKARALSRRYLNESGFTFTTVDGSAAAQSVIDLALATPVVTGGRA